MEGGSSKQSGNTVKTSFARHEDASGETDNTPKRTRSFVLKQMLEELGRIKKESTEAIAEIEASKVNTDPGQEHEDNAGNGKGVMMAEESGGGIVGQQRAVGVPGGPCDKSYHAAIYRKSLQKCSSVRAVRGNTDAGITKRKAVGVTINDEAGGMGDVGKCKIPKREATVVTINDEAGRRRDVGKCKSCVPGTCFQNITARNRIPHRVSQKLKGKGKAAEIGLGQSTIPVKGKGKAEVSRQSVYRGPRGRATKVTFVADGDIRWTRVVDNPKKLRTNVFQIPRGVICACISGHIPRIKLIDCNTNVPYFCEMKKRSDSIERYLCSGWSDFCKDRNLQAGDRLRFCIRYPPVEEILVSVRRVKCD